MKYEFEIEVNQPRSKVIELFDNPDNMKKWQPGFISFEHLQGEAGQPGAKSKVKYKMGKSDIEMIETIVMRNLPDEFSGTYETAGMWNKVENFFSEISPTKTKWKSINEFRASGVTKLIVWFMPGAFKKQTLQYMHLFKKFCENS
jgi:carbon monoxide dehydrogenase subunit G